MSEYMNYTAPGERLREAGVDPKTLRQVATWIYDNEGLCGDLPDTYGMEWFAEALKKAADRIERAKK